MRHPFNKLDIFNVDIRDTVDCPICTSQQLKTDYHLYDDRYGYPGLYPLIRCRKCGHCFLDKKFSSEELSELYTLYYPRRTFDLDQFKPNKEVQGFSSWLQGDKRSAYCWVPPHVRILDIGCGFGETLAYHVSRGCDAYGVEADENAKRAAERFGFKIQIGLFQSKMYPQNFFDYVTMDQVIEHVSDPLQTLTDVAHVLKKDGVLILSTPHVNGWGTVVFGKKWINWHTPYHMHLFSKLSITLAAQHAGFAVQRIETITASDWLYYQFVHLLTYPALNTPSLFWSQKEGSMWGWRKIFVRRLFKLMHVIKITHFATRFFDLIGAGDGMLIILRKQ
jgi:2-polyprenyl-3-methyl-5-hydroxy-6-metoxy-1,4-benzoquinol methylase